MGDTVMGAVVVDAVVGAVGGAVGSGKEENIT